MGMVGFYQGFGGVDEVLKQERTWNSMITSSDRIFVVVAQPPKSGKTGKSRGKIGVRNGTRNDGQMASNPLFLVVYS